MTPDSATYQADNSSKAWERVRFQNDRSSSRTAAFSDDDLIDAWERGKSEGRSEAHQELKALIREKFIENMHRAAELARQVLDALAERKYQYYGVFLGKEDNIAGFRMLIPVNEDSFVEDDFDAVYTIVHQLTASMKTDMFDPSISFVPVDGGPESLNSKALQSDGYIFRLRDNAPQA